MLEIGRAYVPITVPFGFHNRFFSSNDLETSTTLSKHYVSTVSPVPWTPSLHNFHSNQFEARRRAFRPNTWRSQNGLIKFWSQIRTTTNSNVYFFTT